MHSIFSKENPLFEIEFPNLYQDLDTQGFNVYKNNGKDVINITNGYSEAITSPSSSHSTTKDVPANSGIYKFEIHTDSGNLIYIGKAVNLKARFATYLGIVRHLLLVYKGYKTKLSKHPFRYIHYALARAAVDQCAVKFCYYISEAGEDIDRLEFKEISLEAVARIKEDKFHSILNEMPTLNKIQNEYLCEKWRKVKEAICNPIVQTASTLT